jgi:heptosyltransferase-2
MKNKKRRKSRSARPKIAVPDCRRFSGYKPCFPDTTCFTECVDPDPWGTRILIVNLDAMGNVVATTSLLPAIKRKYPQSHISWITLRNAAPLLMNNPYLDRVYLWEPESWMVLQQRTFDVVMNVDKSQRSGAFTMSLKSTAKLGFGINENGVIIPLNSEAEENYRLGLNDHLKFKVNRKSVSQILCETMGLVYQRDPYILRLSPDEETFCRTYRDEMGIRSGQVVVGFNTGCSELYPNKKMRIDQHVHLIRKLSSLEGSRLLLLGGPEDAQRNAEIHRQVGDMVVNTPTTEGVRRGLCYISLCDMVISGDSFGMHASIGLGKQVIAWFGVTSAAEIDLFERGEKLIPDGLECSPCWKRACPYNLECIEMVDLSRIEDRVREFVGSGPTTG